MRLKCFVKLISGGLNEFGSYVMEGNGNTNPLTYKEPFRGVGHMFSYMGTVSYKIPVDNKIGRKLDGATAAKFCSRIWEWYEYLSNKISPYVHSSYEAMKAETQAPVTTSHSA